MEMEGSMTPNERTNKTTVPLASPRCVRTTHRNPIFSSVSMPRPCESAVITRFLSPLPQQVADAQRGDPCKLRTPGAPMRGPVPSPSLRLCITPIPGRLRGGPVPSPLTERARVRVIPLAAPILPLPRIRNSRCCPAAGQAHKPRPAPSPLTRPLHNLCWEGPGPLVLSPVEV